MILLFWVGLPSFSASELFYKLSLCSFNASRVTSPSYSLAQYHLLTSLCTLVIYQQFQELKLQTMSCSCYDLILDESIRRFQQVSYALPLKQAWFYSHRLQASRCFKRMHLTKLTPLLLDNYLERNPAKVISRCTY